jgi:hypothetical protein
MATARKLTTLAAIALAALGCTVSTGTSAHASAAATLDGYPCYSIASYYATRYTGDGSTPENIDLAGPSTASGAAIHLWSYYYNARYGSASTGGGSQLWCLQPIATGEYRLISAYTAMQTGSLSSIDIDGPSSADGTLLHQWVDYSTTSQYWYLADSGLAYNGYELYKIVSAYSGTCVDDTAWGGQGTQLEIYGCKAPDLNTATSTNQLFYLW